MLTFNSNTFLIALLCVLLVLTMWRRNKVLRSLGDEISQYRTQSVKALEDAAAVTRNFSEESLIVQKEAAAVQQRQMDELVKVMTDFLGRAALASPRGLIAVDSPIVRREEQEP